MGSSPCKDAADIPSSIASQGLCVHCVHCTVPWDRYVTGRVAPPFDGEPPGCRFSNAGVALTNVCDEDGRSRYTCCANKRCRLYRACRGITRNPDDGCKEPWPQQSLHYAPPFGVGKAPGGTVGRSL